MTLDRRLQSLRTLKPATLSAAAAASLACLAASGVAQTAWADPPVTCGQRYTGAGQLVEDCVGDITIANGSLNLRGYTLQGSVICEGQQCDVFSDSAQGTIQGERFHETTGIRGSQTSRITLRSVVVTGFGTGVAGGDVVAADSVIAGNSARGIEAQRSVALSDTNVTLNGGDGVHARIGTVHIERSEVTSNGGIGVRALKGVTIRESVVAGNAGDGVQNFAGQAMITSSVVASNGGHGVRTDDSDCTPTGRLELRDSAVEANGHAAECGETRACADVVTCELIQLSATSRCDTSYRMQSGLPGESWRICALD